jgi:hypothetical protein
MRLSVPRVALVLLLLSLTVPAFAQSSDQPTVAAAEESSDTIVSIAGVRVAVDPVTGRLRPPTPEEARQLAAGIAAMVNDSSDGLVEVAHPDGGFQVDLQERFMNVYIAYVAAEGDLRMDCISSSSGVDAVAAAVSGTVPADAREEE